MNAKEEYDRLGKEEEELSFDHFSRGDAWNVGLRIVEKAKPNPLPLGIEIVLNGLMVFRYYPEGITRDHELWLERKRHTVEFREMSSMRLKWMSVKDGRAVTDWQVDPALFALGGGGYPIKIRNTGLIGSICTSGYVDTEDHQIIVDVLREYINSAVSPYNAKAPSA
jgi:uncharacterized protein (UPF0303 family)